MALFAARKYTQFHLDVKTTGKQPEKGRQKNKKPRYKAAAELILTC